jgi:hypothetical protein
LTSGVLPFTARPHQSPAQVAALFDVASRQHTHTEELSMFNRYAPVLVVVFGIVLSAVLGTAAQSGVRTNTFNNLTFPNAFTLPGVTMPAGTYVFESGPNGTNPNIVRVSSKDRLRTFYEGLTIPIARPVGHGLVTLGEAVRGAPVPVVAWYPIGTTRAHEFQYP